MQKMINKFSIIIFFFILNCGEIIAQKSRFSISAGGNWGYNSGLITNGRNSGTGLGWNMTQDATYNLFKTIDYSFGANYHLKNENLISIEYRKYQLRQVYYQYPKKITLDIRNPLHSCGVFIRHNWNKSGMKTAGGKKRKLTIFTQHGVNFLFDSNIDIPKFSSTLPKTVTTSYNRFVNFRSFSIINYIISNSIGINHTINDKFSIDYYADFNIGIRNLYTNLIIFREEYADSPGVISFGESFTGMNKGDKIGIGVKINYRLSKKN